MNNANPHSLEERVEPPLSVATLEAALTIIHDRLNDPALGEAIERLETMLVPWLDSMVASPVAASFRGDRDALKAILDALTALRSPVL